MVQVAVVGARRARQGIGEYVARDLASAGCRVVAIVGTGPETVAQAQQTLKERYGITARGYVGLDALLANEALDAVAVCSPAHHHLEQLEALLAARVHVLCEKPLVWWPGLADDAAASEALVRKTQRLVAGFHAAGRMLWTVTQWPCVLDGLYQLHPELKEETPHHLLLRLSPISRGTGMWVDSGSHLLSLVEALVGEGELEEPRISLGEGGERLRLTFGIQHPGGLLQVECRLHRCPQPPRPAGIGLNGRYVERTISLPQYQMGLSGPTGRVDIPDPLTRLVAGFVAAIKQGEITPLPLAQRIKQLHELATRVRQLETRGGCDGDRSARPDQGKAGRALGHT